MSLTSQLEAGIEIFVARSVEKPYGIVEDQPIGIQVEQIIVRREIRKRVPLHESWRSTTLKTPFDNRHSIGSQKSAVILGEQARDHPVNRQLWRVTIGLADQFISSPALLFPLLRV